MAGEARGFSGRGLAFQRTALRATLKLPAPRPHLFDALGRRDSGESGIFFRSDFPGEAMEIAAIRALIRDKLQDGRLPGGSTPRVFGRPGNWQKCDACEETMANALLMKEVYPLTKNKKAVRFHGDCYILWNDERRGLVS